MPTKMSFPKVNLHNPLTERAGRLTFSYANDWWLQCPYLSFPPGMRLSVFPRNDQVKKALEERRELGDDSLLHTIQGLILVLRKP